jgi:hypothetical protein
MMQEPIQDKGKTSPIQKNEVDVLHARHPAVLDAVSVLTRGSAEAGAAFRQSDEFLLRKPGGKEIGGKAGDYILVFKVPEGITISPELIEQIKQNGIPSKDYWVSIIDGAILNFSYSTKPLCDEVIGAAGLSYGEQHLVYKAAGLKQKALIPSERQTQLRSLESDQAGGTQSIDDNELVLLDIQGNPYPKWASQFVTQFKPDPGDFRSEALFEQVHARYKV